MLEILCFFCIFVSLEHNKHQVLAADDNDENAVVLSGGGASTAYEAFQQWGLLYRNYRADYKKIVSMYRNLGTLGGFCRIKNECSFGLMPIFICTWNDITDTDRIKYPSLMSFPAYAAAAAIMYNLPEINDLRLSLLNLIDILSVNLTWWNDTRLQQINPHVKLPKERIAICLRIDDVPHLLPQTLTLDDIKYPTTSTIGMVGILSSISYTIGFGPHADAVQNQIKIAWLYNNRKKLIAPDQIEKGIYSAMNYFASRNDTQSLTNADDDDSYPLAVYPKIVLNGTTFQNFTCDQMVELVRFFDWGFNSQEIRDVLKSFLMFPLTPELIDMVRERYLKSITCEGRNVYQMIESEMIEEHRQKTSLQQILLISIPTILILTVLVATLAFCLLYRLRLKQYDSLWMIGDNEVKMHDLSTLTSTRKSIKSASTIGRRETRSTMDCSIAAAEYGPKYDCETKSGQFDHKKVLLMRERSQLRVTQYSIHTRKAFHWLCRDIVDPHLLKFLGVTIAGDDSSTYFVFDYPDKGNLHQMLMHSRFDFGDDVKMALVYESLLGMEYLHTHQIIHGCFNSLTCFLDSNWAIKIGHWTQTKLCELQNINILTVLDYLSKYQEFTEYDYLKKFYTDPVLLKRITNRVEKQHDIYSFGVLMIEILTRKMPFDDEMQLKSLPDILADVMQNERHPKYTSVAIPRSLQHLIYQCFGKEKRPSFKELTAYWSENKLSSQKSVVECMMRHWEAYMTTLEHTVEDRTSELKTMSTKMEHLLFEMLPKQVASKLLNNEYVEPELFEQVTIYFSDIIDFKEMSAICSPDEIVNFLNAVYILFDKIIDTFDVYKVETISDSYMVASGLPVRNGEKHAPEVTKMALRILHEAASFAMPPTPNQHHHHHRLQIRVGLNTGPCMTGVVGLKMPRYCLFGDTVNTASRMETNSLPSKIHASESTALILKNYVDDFVVTYRGTIPVKGKGNLNTYWIRSISDPVLTEFEQLESANNNNFHAKSSAKVLHVEEKQVQTDDVLFNNNHRLRVKESHESAEIRSLIEAATDEPSSDDDRAPSFFSI